MFSCPRCGAEVTSITREFDKPTIYGPCGHYDLMVSLPNTPPTLRFGDVVMDDKGNTWRVGWWNVSTAGTRAVVHLVSPEEWAEARALTPSMPE